MGQCAVIAGQGFSVVLNQDVIAQIMLNRPVIEIAAPPAPGFTQSFNEAVVAQGNPAVDINGQVIQGPPGPPGQAGTGDIDSSTEFTATDSLQKTITLAHVANGSVADLRLNGLGQPRSSYSVSGTTLTIPAGILFPGADVTFEYSY